MSPAEGPDRWAPPDLTGRVAVVTGASRGVGRGIAEVLGASGATVYVVARTLRAQGRSGIEDVVEAITGAGGLAYAAPCDVGDDKAVAALFERLSSEQGRVDILVNNAVGWGDVRAEGWEGVEDTMTYMVKPAWEMPAGWWDANFRVGVRSHYIVTKAAVPLMMKDDSGGVVLFTSERRPETPGMQELVLDLRASAVERLALLWSLHLRPRGIASILLYPGFTRTEGIEESFATGGSYFDGWTEERFLSETASIYYSGRATAVLAADPLLMERTGSVLTAAEVAREYGFTDVSGAQPDPE